MNEYIEWEYNPREEAGIERTEFETGEFYRKNLDNRICDVVKGATNTETYREFIWNTEEEYGLGHENLDELTDEQLEIHMDVCDEIWSK